ncbi:hypothetical protein SteCoe_12375 [Stentor coeruleus]|uniref:Importin N-terminal domain-containing protein n=1 Tax=Stentor coeruleus TaxID=5963 RepID=A0A1R2CAZ0_9CILI|nr:hypothetical protein SteCoe_12375 [Stentor coeruleus]
MEEFQKILLSILSKNHEIRDYGESAFNSLLTQSSDNVCYTLISCIASALEDLSSLSAVLFRRLFIQKALPLPQNSDNQIKSSLISLISENRPLSLLKKIGDILIPLSHLLNFSNEILVKMTFWLSSSSQILQLFSLYLFEISTENNHIIMIIDKNADSVLQLMWNSLQSNDVKVKTAACRTTCLVLSRINENDNYRKAFSIILDFFQNLPVEETTSALTALAELIDNSPMIVLGSVDKIAQIMTGICKTNTIFYDVKLAAIQVLHAIIQRSFGIIKDNIHFIQETITLSLLLISEIEFANDLNAWDVELETDTTENIHTLGKELLCTIVEAFSETAYPHLIILIEAHINAAHWLHKYTGILALGLISSDCAKSIGSCLENYITILINLSSHEHPRVRWACLTTIGLFCTVFAPEIQKSYSQSILSIIIGNIKQNNIKKLRIQALNCIVNYTKGLDEDFEIQKFTSFLPEIVTCFSSFFISPSTTLSILNEVLKSLSAISLEIDSFRQYLPLFLPGLRALFLNGMPENNNFTSQALTCLGCFARCADIKNVEDILNDMLRLKQLITSDNENYNNLLDVIVSCLETVGQNHLDLLDLIIKELLNNAGEYTEIFNESLEFKKGLFNDVSLEIYGIQDKNTEIPTGTYETKLGACRLLYILSTSLGKLYINWAGETLETMNKLVFFPLNKKIRKFALKIVTFLPTICEPIQKNAMILTIFPYFMTNLAERINTYPEDVCSLVTSMKKISKNTENISFIGITGAQALAEVLSENIKAVILRGKKRKVFIGTVGNGKLYCEELENIKESEEIDAKILRNSVDFIGILMKSFKNEFLGFFKVHFQSLFGELLYDSEASDHEILSSLCLFCDYIEFTGDLLVNQDSSLLLTAFNKLAYHENHNIRQCAVYGIGLGAIYGNSQIFAKHQNQCIEACKNILSNPCAFTDEFIECTECAAGAIGKIALNYSEELIQVWMEYLPFKSDPEEACITHDLFIRNFDKISKYQNAYLKLEQIKTAPKGYVFKETLDVL